VDVSLLRQRERLHRLAAAWRAAYPSSADALEGVVIALDLLGNAAALDSLRVARRMAADADDALRLASLEVWLRVKRATPSGAGSLREARRLADSVLRGHEPADRREARTLAALAALLGRAHAAAALTEIAEASDVPPALAHAAPALLAYAALGGPADSLRRYEAEVDRAIRSILSDAEGRTIRADWLARAAFLAAPEHRFAAIPASGAGSLRGDLLSAWSARDLPRARRALATMSAARERAGVRAFGVTTDGLYQEAAMLAALGDDDRALAWLSPTLDSLRFVSPRVLAEVAYAGSLVRAMVLRADLEAREGDAGSARAWASAVAELWAEPDAWLQPVVERMRSAAR
jgi:hypothetical protein